MQLTLADGSQIQCQDGQFAEGTDGVLHLTSDGKHVVKLYKQPEPWRHQTIHAILNQYNVVRGHSYWEQFFAWPNAIVTKPRLGIRMRRVRDQKPLGALINYKYRMRRLSAAERGTWLGYAASVIKIARMMRRLHLFGLCHSDLSENNLLIDPVKGQVTLLDCDGLVIPRVIAPVVLGTRGFMAPELVEGKARPSIRTDLHALAVIIYRLLLIVDPFRGPKKHHADPLRDDELMYGANALFIDHPTDRSNRPRSAFPSTRLLGEDVHRLFLRAFVDTLRQPERRPSALDWERVLTWMYDRTIPCPNPACEFKAFVFDPARPHCPWCNIRLKTPRSLPLFDFYARTDKQYHREANHTLVGHPDRYLHLWHAYTGKLPGPDVDGAPVAHLHYERSSDSWFLMAHNLPDLRLVTDNGSQPAPNSTIPLVSGMRLLFGDPATARAASVQIIRL